MLDLDSLAEKRAQDLKEELARWRDVMWGPDFAQVARNMSDGEIEMLVANCGSVIRLERVLRFVLQHAETGAKLPFAIMTGAAQSAGLTLSDWINSL